MNLESLIQSLPVLLFLALMLAYFWYRGTRKRLGDKYEIFCATHSTALPQATEDMRRVFDGMLPQNEADVSLLRLSLMNRGDKLATPENFLRPVRISLPAESRILDARAVERTGTAQHGLVSMSPSLNILEITPFPLPPHSSVIFNIVVDGAATPIEMDGALDGQPELLKLG